MCLVAKATALREASRRRSEGEPERAMEDEEYELCDCLSLSEGVRQMWEGLSGGAVCESKGLSM